jgi:hypothetical protein
VRPSDDFPVADLPADPAAEPSGAASSSESHRGADSGAGPNPSDRPSEPPATAEAAEAAVDLAPIEHARRALDGLPQRPLEEHAPVYERLHAELQRALAAIDGA